MALLLLLGALYHPVLRLFWTYDDPFHIRYVSAHTALQYAAEPAAWRELPFRMFTPLQMVSYELDLGLFGLRPEGWYLHQLIALLLAAATLFALARAWLETLPAALLVLAMLLGPATNEWIQLLMARQYLEGLIAAGLSLLAVRRFAGTSKWGWLALACVAYLAAAAFKEIYVLGCLLALAVPMERRLRLMAATGFLGTLAVYLTWRWLMLGTLLGGYGWAVEAADLPRLLAALPGKILTAQAGGSWAGVALVLATLLLAGSLVFLDRRAAALGLIALAVSVAPFVPVASEFADRYAVPAWLVLSALAAAGAEALGRRYRLRPVLLMGGLVVLALIANRLAWKHSFGELERMSAEGRYLWSSQERTLLRKPTLPPATSSELSGLRLATLETEAPGTFYDDLFVCLHAPAVPIVELDPATKRVVPRPGAAERLRSGFCSSIAQDAPLSARFRWQGDRLGWELGPYDDGEYSLVLADGAVAYRVPRKAAFHRGGEQPITLRVKYEGRGLTTYSPELQLEASRSEQHWQRGAPPPS